MATIITSDVKDKYENPIGEKTMDAQFILAPGEEAVLTILSSPTSIYAFGDSPQGSYAYFAKVQILNIRNTLLQLGMLGERVEQ